MGFRKSLFYAFALFALASLSAQAAEFAIESEVFTGNDSKPLATNLTIFSDGLIYDFSINDERVTILDAEAKRFLLADSRQQTQASITMDELIRFVAAQTQKARQSPIELIRFAATPKFETTFNESTGQLSLSSDYWDYRVETTPITDAELGSQYNEFAQWFAQLNAVFRPIPPAVRMELNHELRQRHRLPERVVVHIKKNGRTSVRQESRHRLIKDLTQRERQMLKNWNDRKASYLRVPFHEFRLTQLPTASNQR